MAGQTWICVALVAALGSSGGRAVAQQSEPLCVQMTRLELRLAVDYGRGTLAGSAVLWVRNASDQPVTKVPLQVHRLMRFTDARDVEGHPAPLEQALATYADVPLLQVRQAWVTLPRPLAPGAATAVRVGWEGKLWGYQETGMLYVKDHVDPEFTVIRGDARAFPTPAVLSRLANRSLPDQDFDFELSVTVPKNEVVAAGGTLAGRAEGDSTASYSYRSAQPVPFLNITIAPYRVVERGGIRIYHFPADSAGAAMVLAGAVGATDLLTRWFGPLGQALRLTVMEIPDGYGSQASLAAGILQDASAFRDRRQLHQLYHELSHLWNAPDTDRPPVRWNEGLASVLEDEMAAQLDDIRRPARYLEERYLPWFYQRFRSDPSNLTTPFIQYGRTGKTDLSYGVGYLMFTALHDLLGADAFNRALGGWYQERRERGGTTDEFVAYLKRSVPTDLGPFFQDWLYTTRWYQRLQAGETLSDIVASYRTRTARQLP